MGPDSSIGQSRVLSSPRVSVILPNSGEGIERFPPGGSARKDGSRLFDARPDDDFEPLHTRPPRRSVPLWSGITLGTLAVLEALVIAVLLVRQPPPRITLAPPPVAQGHISAAVEILQIAPTVSVAVTERFTLGFTPTLDLARLAGHFNIGFMQPVTDYLTRVVFNWSDYKIGRASCRERV